jgi:hypothetical protein
MPNSVSSHKHPHHQEGQHRNGLCEVVRYNLPQSVACGGPQGRSRCQSGAGSQKDAPPLTKFADLGHDGKLGFVAQFSDKDSTKGR